MTIAFEGTAILVDMQSFSIVEIEGDEMTLDVWSSTDRQMGPETEYHVAMDHEILGQLKWSIWEYPVGSINLVRPPKGEFRILKDFEFSIVHDREDEEPEYIWSVDEQTDIRTNHADQSIQYMKTWFFQNFWDPANETPYNGREGGYLYVYGGPYNAADELYGHFGDVFDDDEIHQAIDEVEAEGILDWAPMPGSSYHENPLDEEYEDDEGAGLDKRPGIEEISAFDSIRQSLANGAEPNLNDGYAREKRADLLNHISVLEDVLDRYGTAGIGHNQPPESIGEMPVNPEVIRPALKDL